jgi:hypothetical protein
MSGDALVSTVPGDADDEGWVELTEFKLTSHLGVTMTINGQDWIKTGATTSMTFRDLPPDEQIDISLEHMRNKILGPAVDEAIVAINHRLEEARRRKS